MYEIPKLDLVLDAEDFASWIGRPVRVDTYPQPVDIELTAIQRRPGSALTARKPFTLFFRSHWNVMLVDAVYSMSCGGSGPYEITLTPITPEPPVRIYQAIFN